MTVAVPAVVVSHHHQQGSGPIENQGVFERGRPARDNRNVFSATVFFLEKFGGALQHQQSASPSDLLREELAQVLQQQVKSLQVKK